MKTKVMKLVEIEINYMDVFFGGRFYPEDLEIIKGSPNNRRNYLNFTMDQIVSIVDHINIKDCAMNQIVYQGAQCLLCPLIAPSGKSCYRDMGFIVK